MSVCISPTFIGGWNLEAELQKELDALSARSHLSSSSSSAGDAGSIFDAKSEALLDSVMNVKLDMLLNGWREKEKKLQEYEQSLRKIHLWQGDLDDRELRSKWQEDTSESGTAEHVDPSVARQVGPMMEPTGGGTFGTASKSTYKNHDTQNQGDLKQRVNLGNDKSHVTEVLNLKIGHQGDPPVQSPRKVSSYCIDSSDTVDHEGDLSDSSGSYFEQDPLLNFQIRKRKMLEDIRTAEVQRGEESDKIRKAEAEESERRIVLASQRRQELEEEWQNEQKRNLASLEVEQNMKIRLFEELHRTEEIKLELEKQETEKNYKVLENLSDTYRHMEDEQDLRRLNEDNESVKLMLSQAIQLQEQSNIAAEKCLSKCCTQIQAVVRGYLCRKKYKNLKSCSSYATLQKNIPPKSLGSGLEASSLCRGTLSAHVDEIYSDQQSLEEVSMRLQSLLESGNMEQIHSCLELVRSLGLEEEACSAEVQLYQKQESMQNWLTQVINGWAMGRSNLQKQFEEACRLDLAPTYAVAEVVVFAREKEITDGLDMAIVTASRRDFHQWISEANLMGLEDAIRSSSERFLTRLNAVQERLRKESKLGSKDRYTLCLKEATSLGLQSDIKDAVKAILKRILQFLRRATLLVGAKSAQDWKTVKTEAAQIGLDIGLIEFLKESIRHSQKLEGITRVWIMTYKVDETGMPCDLISKKYGSVPGLDYRDTESELLVGLTDSWSAHLLGSASSDQKQQLIHDMLEQEKELCLTSHDWLEMLRLQHIWQQHMENVKLGELHGSQEDTGHSGRQDEVEESEYIDDSTAFAVSDGHNTKQNLHGPHELTTTPTEITLTRKMLEEKFNSDREKLRWVMSLDLINKGITSLGRKGLFRWCPRLKSLSVDLNKLTTLKQAFEGGQEELEQLSVRENLLQSFSGLEGLQRLSVLHLDGNLLTQIIPDESDDGKEGNFTYHDICWSRLQILTLSCNRLTDVSKLGHLCPNLEILDLGSNQLLSLGKGKENALAGLQHLRVLDVGQNKLKNKSLWDGLMHCPELVSLVASRNHLTELPRHFGSVLLREIWLNGNAIEAFECKVWLPSLQRLYLQDNLITSMEPVWGCPALEVLDLSFNCISECSQLQHLSCFPNLRSLQLNDNPVSDKEDHADYILQAVPWLQELDNEAVAKASRHQAISTIFKSVMEVAGVTFLKEKLTRGEALVRGFTNPCSAHKLSFSNREHNENRRSQFLNRSISEVNDVMNGKADEEILWGILLEVKELALSSKNFRSLLMMNGNLTKLGCLQIYTDLELEAKCTMTAYQQMACGLRSKLHAATKENSYRVLKDAEISELRTFRNESTTNWGRESISPEPSMINENERSGASHLEWCLEEHSTFNPWDYTATYTENIEYRLEAQANTRRVIKLQSLARGHMARIRVKSLINERNKRRELELQMRIVRVQAIWRGWTIRRRKILLHLRVEQMEKKLENTAAISIQATWHGYITRLKFQQALRKSKYIDDDEFEYIRIDESDFLAGESALASYQPADMYLYAVGSSSTGSNTISAKQNCSFEKTKDGIQEEDQEPELSKFQKTSPVPELDSTKKPGIERRTDVSEQPSGSDSNYRGESEYLANNAGSIQKIPVGSRRNCTKNSDKSDPEKIVSSSPKKNLDCSTHCTNNEPIMQPIENCDKAAVVDFLEATEKEDLNQNIPLNSLTVEHTSPDETKGLDKKSLDDLLKKMGIPSPFPSRPSSVDPVPTYNPDNEIAMATTSDKHCDSRLLNTSVDAGSQSTTERIESQAREGKKKALSDEMKAAVDLEEIAKDWGFKNTRTAEAYLKARERTMKQAKSAAHQNILRDPETRFKLFKAKLGGPIPSRVAPLRQSESQAPSAMSDAEKHAKGCKNRFREQPSNGVSQTSAVKSVYIRRNHATRMSLPLSSITNASTETKVTEMKKDIIHKDIKRTSINSVQGGLSPWQIPKLNLNASLDEFHIRDAQDTKRVGT